MAKAGRVKFKNAPKLSKTTKEPSKLPDSALSKGQKKRKEKLLKEERKKQLIQSIKKDITEKGLITKTNKVEKQTLDSTPEIVKTSPKTSKKSHKKGITKHTNKNKIVMEGMKEMNSLLNNTPPDDIFSTILNKIEESTR